MEKPIPRRVLMAVRLGLLVLLAAVGWRAAVVGTTLDIAAAFGMACIASLLVSPLSWAHHYPVALPGLLAVPIWQWRRGAVRMAKWLAGGACARDVDALSAVGLGRASRRAGAGRPRSGSSSPPSGCSASGERCLKDTGDWLRDSRLKTAITGVGRRGACIPMSFRHPSGVSEAANVELAGATPSAGSLKAKAA